MVAISHLFCLWRGAVRAELGHARALFDMQIYFGKLCAQAHDTRRELEFHHHHPTQTRAKFVPGTKFPEHRLRTDSVWFRKGHPWLVWVSFFLGGGGV